MKKNYKIKVEDKKTGNRFEYTLQLNEGQLEKIAEGICPFTRKIEIEPNYGSFGNIVEYLCAVDGVARGGHINGVARGGHIKIDGCASTPCSIEYAQTCPLYQGQTLDF